MYFYTIWYRLIDRSGSSNALSCNYSLGRQQIHLTILFDIDFKTYHIL